MSPIFFLIYYKYSLR